MKIELLPVSQIKPYPGNPRKNAAAVDPVAKSIREFGFRQAIVVDKNFVIIVGHTRLLAAIQLELQTVPVHVATDLTPEQITAYRLADNKTNEFSEWDLGKLRIELNDLKSKAYDVALTGFTIRDLSLLGTTIKTGQTDPEEIPDQAPPKCSHGQIYKLGDHRLTCGDSINPICFHRLLADENVDAVITDPPYNVDYEGKTKDKLKIENDKMKDEHFYNFLLTVFQHCKTLMKDGAPIYVCYVSSQGLNFYKAFQDAGLLYKQELIWVKNTMVLGRQDYQWQHEPIMYGWKPGGAHKWYAGFDKKTVIDENPDLQQMTKGDLIKMVRQYQNEQRTTVIRADKPNRSEMHPTTKPIALIQNFILNSTEKDDVVLDPFGGSGSTMIACEMYFRRCRMIESDPKYCDVIINRWENFTGKKAQLLNG